MFECSIFLLMNKGHEITIIEPFKTLNFLFEKNYKILTLLIFLNFC